MFQSVGAGVGGDVMPADLYFDIFQSISQRRRQGMLSIHAPAGKVLMTCLDGRVVGVTSERFPTSIGVAQRLYTASLLHERAYNLVQRRAVPIDQLAEMLVGRRFVSEEQFLRARSTHEMNIALSLRYLDDAVIEFASREVRADLRYPWSISTGELLLDMCELESDGDRFCRHLIGAGDEPVTVVSTGDMPRTASPSERVLFDMIRVPRDVRLLFGALLNEAEVTEGLLTLLELGLIEVRRGAADQAVHEAVPTPAPDNDDAADDQSGPDDLELAPELDGSSALYDKIANEAIGSMLDGFDDLTLAAFQEEMAEAPAEPIPEPKPEAANAPKAAANESAKPTAQEALKPIAPAPLERRDVMATEVRPSPAAAPSPAPVSVPAPAPARVANPTTSGDASPAPQPAVMAPPRPMTQHGDITQGVMHGRTFHDRLIELNIRCSTRELRERLAVAAVLTFLVLFVLCSLTRIGPVENWLHSLEQFTSGANLGVIHSDE